MIAGLPAIKGHCCVRTQFPDSSLSAFGFAAEARPYVRAQRLRGLNRTFFLPLTSRTGPNSTVHRAARCAIADPDEGAGIRAGAREQRKQRNG